MTSTMFQSVMLTFLMHNTLLSPGVRCLKPADGASLRALDLPWRDELCCNSLTNRSGSVLPYDPRCSFAGSAAESRPREASDLKSPFNTGICLDILCRIDEDWEKLMCNVKSQTSTAEDTGPVAIGFQHLLSQNDDSWVNDGETVSDNPVVCEADDSFVCSVPLDATTNFITVVTISLSDTKAPLVRLRIPARPEKPSPPVNLSHIQTIEAELILLWDDPSDSRMGPLRYEVRHSFNTTHPAWQVVSSAEPRLSLDLKPTLNYTIQVRCSSPEEPPLWSDWSESHHIYLHSVSYIPEKVVTHAGEEVTIYCVFNDHSVNASAAIWVLNFQQTLHRSQYHPINQRVSQITVRPSETRMYDLLQCTKEWTNPYSQIYVEGASIGINCVTNGDIDAMDCSWKNTQWTEPKLRFRWSDLPCDLMEEKDRAGEEVGKLGPACLQVRSKKSCIIQPLRMNCYKLWLEVASRLGPIRSKPVYLSPIDHVKPNTPTNVKALSQSSGALLVTWEPPTLPVEGLQCQLRYHSLSMVRAQPQWKVQSPVRVASLEVAVPDMCQVYVVQVRCMHTNGTGYWSEWSDSVYSAPQNSRAPEHGPNFWRILQDEPHRNQTNVTLLFKDLPVSGRSYCVDGFVVQHQDSSGVVTSVKSIEPASFYSFEWNREPQTVSVVAYNSRGSSTNNINMTLERKPKRRCVRSFSVSIINSTSVSLSWILLDNSSVPVSMVVQWTIPQRQQGSAHQKAYGGELWVRLPYTDGPVHLRGDFFGSEEYGFHLYPVFADGEGEPVYTIATRGDPAAYMMLMIISFLAIVLFITLLLSHNQMKKFVWKDVPNPNKCSWAKGLDFKKNHALFGPSEGLPTWSLLMPSENLSKVVIVDRADLSVLTTALVQTPLMPLTTDPAAALPVSLRPGLGSDVDQGQFRESETLSGGASSSDLNLDALTSSYPRIEELLPVVSQPPGSAVNSAQSSVTYTTVLLSDPKQEQPPIHRHYKGGSGSSSSDEGNFSANNSDISGSFPGGLWELESCRGGEADDPRRSCSYNSVEELSETSEQEDEGEVRGEEKDLYYLGMDYPAEDEESEEDEEQREEQLRKNAVLNREACCVEARPLLGPEDSSEGFSPLYLPQFRTAASTRQQQDGRAQL